MRLHDPTSAQVFDSYGVVECLPNGVQLFCEFCRERPPFLPLPREEIRRKDAQVIDLHGPSRSPFSRTYRRGDWRLAAEIAADEFHPARGRVDHDDRTVGALPVL